MDIAEVVLMAGLGAAALIERHVMLQFAAFIGLIIWGLEVADTYLVPGICVCMVAGYFLWRGISQWVGR